MGIANVNVAKVAIDDVNDRGGLLGCPVESFVEDSATDDSVAEVAAARLVERAVDVVVAASTARRDRPSGDPWSTKPRRCTSTRSSTKVRSVRPLIFCTGPVPAQQVA
jgi:ABC-type branched-subunit amino acid transport system substrate-binding protein